MQPRLRRSVVFAETFVHLFLVLLWLYPKALPVYQRTTTGAANPVLRAMGPPYEIALDAEGNWIASRVMDDGTREPHYRAAASDRHLLYLNLALLPALLLATPIDLVSRLRLLGWGVVLLFAFHVAMEISLLRVARCLDLDPGNRLCAWVWANLRIAGQSFAVLQWSLLTWRHWLPPSTARMPVRVEGKLPRNAPCPCGSGRRFKRCCGA